MKNYIAIILTLLVSTATAQQQKLPGNLYYLGDDLETTSIADKQTALVVVEATVTEIAICRGLAQRRHAL